MAGFFISADIEESEPEFVVGEPEPVLAKRA